MLTYHMVKKWEMSDAAREKTELLCNTYCSKISKNTSARLNSAYIYILSVEQYSTGWYYMYFNSQTDGRIKHKQRLLRWAQGSVLSYAQRGSCSNWMPWRQWAPVQHEKFQYMHESGMKVREQRSSRISLLWSTDVDLPSIQEFSKF